MGRLTDISMAHPDKTVATIGAFGGFVAGAMHGGSLPWALGGAVLWGIMSLLIAHTSPRDPTYGPHQ